ncbi:MAG: iron-containing alcohol dehydrogenase [Gammaproteobacteria bacterium]|nr:iron-containing alcohol dehydrogenase [Gammaproteobacteria bacterium]
MPSPQTVRFSTTSDIVFGAGSVGELGAVAAQLGIRHALLVTDGGIAARDMHSPACASLAASGIGVTVCADVIADPPTEVVLAATDFARRAGCDGVIGFGGGSSMDTAKLVAVLLCGEQPLEEMYGVDRVRSRRLPLIQIPTTAGTGSEVTMVAVVTTGATTKMGVVSRTLLADRVILDPELTLSMPAPVTAATGIDAMVHAIEAFTSLRLKNPLSDMLAREALRLLAGHIRRAVSTPQDIEARGAMLLGAMYAGQAFANAPVAAVHALAYPLGGNYHLAHGLSNSLVLPHVLRFNEPAAEPLYRQLLPLVLGETAGSGATAAGKAADRASASARLATHFLALAGELGIATRLRDCGVPREDLPRLAAEALLQQRLLVNNPRVVSEPDALAIYEQAY